MRIVCLVALRYLCTLAVRVGAYVGLALRFINFVDCAVVQLQKFRFVLGI